MSTVAVEWLHLASRWVHVIASIMWIGDSFLFMWLDRNLVAPRRPREGAVAGELWMVHSGGFYEVVKRRALAPGELPGPLHWFKWEAYSTWISGFFLLGVLYYTAGGLYLVDRGVSGIPFAAAVALSVGVLPAGWLVYDGLWRSPLARRPALATLVSYALVVGAAYGLTRVFSGRAAYVHLGAVLGSIMAANVWRRIIPAQRQMIAAVEAGSAVDLTLGERAKLRSVHNHYLTLPVLLTMLSNHFPGTYGHRLGWLVLALLIVVGAAAKYVMSFRSKSNRWVVIGGTAALVAVIALTARGPGSVAAAPDFSASPPVRFETAQAILQRRCVNCHAARPSNPSFAEAPSGVTLEDPIYIQRLAPRILARAVLTRTMPLGNLTGMTEEERALLGAWIAQGARVEGAAARPPHVR